MNTLRIRGRLIAGFGAVLLIMVMMAGTMVTKVAGIGILTHSITEKRVPTAATSARLVNSINASLAAQRTGEVSEKIETVRDASGATGTAAQSVLDDANGLAHQAQEVKAKVEGFLSAMRQA